MDFAKNLFKKATPENKEEGEKVAEPPKDDLKKLVENDAKDEEQPKEFLAFEEEETDTEIKKEISSESKIPNDGLFFTN